MFANQHSWIELKKSSFENNVSIYKKIVKYKKIAAIIKSNAYGHGIIEIARLCDINESIDFLCVSGLSEALHLRSYGIEKPILVLSYIDYSLEHAINKNIEFMISDTVSAQEINQQAIALNTQFNVHLKIDTGLSRLGFSPKNIEFEIDQLKTLSNIVITGLATHFAESNAIDLKFTLYQRDLFYETYNKLVNLGIDFKYIHASNTAATSAIDLSFCTMFRVGAGLYGIWPSESNKLITENYFGPCPIEQVISWKTKIILIKQIEQSQSIGYCRTYLTTKPTKIALIPIGYYDGYDLNLYNIGSVLVQQKLAPIVGRISMNLMTLDITDIPDVSLGDEVQLLANVPGITLEGIAKKINVSNIRELVTKINPHLMRVIV